MIALFGCRPRDPVVPGQCAEQWAAAELEALKANARRDPAATMNRLGVDVEDFEPVAKALYKSWLEKHPEARPKMPEGSPRTFENGTLVVGADHWFWCFANRSTGLEMCASTRDLCEHFKGADDVGCTPTGEMTCYHTKVEGQSKTAGWCFRTVEDCKMGMRAWPGPEPIVLGCATLRYDPRRPAHP